MNNARNALLAGLAGIAATVASNAFAHTPDIQLSVDEITRGLVGMVCTTRAGARFTFEIDGHYTYDGLWQNQGHYLIGKGVVKVTLDSGLERSYEITRKDGEWYMEHVRFANCRLIAK